MAYSLQVTVIQLLVLLKGVAISQQTDSGQSEAILEQCYTIGATCMPSDEPTGSPTEICQTYEESVTCMQKGVDACRKSNFHSGIIESSEQRIKELRHSLISHCSDVITLSDITPPTTLSVKNALVSSSEAVTCKDISTCTPDVSQFGGSANKKDMQKTCMLVRDSIKCFRDAMADCRKGGNIPEEKIRTLETQMDSYDQMLQNSCGSDGSVAISHQTDTGQSRAILEQCYTIGARCMPSEQATRSPTEKCQTYEESVTCMQKGVEACRKSNLHPGTIESSEQMIKELRHSLHMQCSDVINVSGENDTDPGNGGETVDDQNINASAGVYSSFVLLITAFMLSSLVVFSVRSPVL